MCVHHRHGYRIKAAVLCRALLSRGSLGAMLASALHSKQEESVCMKEGASVKVEREGCLAVHRQHKNLPAQDN